jgi:uncharacterized protein (DUF2249 family)
MISINNIIDCRNKKCSLEYVSIEENFNSISNGESIQLKTTINPKKLFFELLTKQRGKFYWIPIKDGPNEWDVMIEKSSGM